MASLFKIIAGSAEVALGAATEFFAPGNPLGTMLMIGGTAQIIGGALQKRPVTGTTSTEKNPIAPWRIGYGRFATGGTLLYDFEWGGGPGSNNVRDLVVCLAANRCAIDSTHPAVMKMDQARLQIDTAAVPTQALAGFPMPAPNPCSGTSFTPKWQDNVQVTAMSRSNGVVTVTLAADIPYLSGGDRFFVQGANYGIAGADLSFNGVFPVANILNAPASHTGGAVGLGTAFTFEYLSGGLASTPNIAVSGHNASVSTEWPVGSPTGHSWANYANTVYVEYLAGQQALGQTFIGQLVGTPYEPSGGSNGGLGTPASPHNYGGSPTTNPWTANCSAQGKTLAFIRVLYQKDYYTAGLPLISFNLYGKNDIYDPRLGAYGAAGTTTYTENAALIIADFLHTGAPLSAPYDPGATYAAGAVSSFQAAGQTFGIDYVSAADGNSGHQPDTHPVQWTPVTSATLPVNWTAGEPFGLGALCSFQSANSSVPVQYVSKVAGNTGNQPDTHATQWAPLAMSVYPLPDWGYRLPYGTAPTLQNPEYIDTNALIAAANVCDQAVTLANGGTEPRYAINGSFDLTQNRGEILADMLMACAGRLSVIGGAYAIIPGAWYGSGSTGFPNGSVAGGSTAVNLTAIADGPFSWEYASPRDVHNGVKGTFVSPYHNWQATDFPYYAQDEFHGYSGPAMYGGDINLQADGGDRRWMELHLPYTISASMAQRIAKIALLRSRWAGLPPCAANSFPGGGTGRFALNASGYRFVAADILSASVAFLWSGSKLLEAGTTRFHIDANNGEPKLSTELEAAATDASIYAWTTAEELSPEGYAQVSFPTGTFQETHPLPWSPGQAVPLAGDAIGGAATFGLTPAYAYDAQGNAIVQVAIAGTPPVNATDTEIAAPVLKCTANTSGGSLADGYYVVGLAARNAGGSNYALTGYHTLCVVLVQGGGGSGSISITTDWGAGSVGGDLYMGVWQSQENCVLHWQQTLATGVTSGAIASFSQATAGGPDPDCDHLAVTWQAVEHSGVFDGQIPSAASITATTVTMTAPASTVDQWAGYMLSLLGRQSGEVPVINLPILHNTVDTAGLVTFTIGPGVGGTLPNLTTLLQALDLLVMRGRYVFTGNSATDPNVANSYYPTGADASVEPGHVGVMLTGSCAGQVQSVTGVTLDTHGNYTVFEFAAPFQSYDFATGLYSPPATGDVLIFCSPTVTEVPCARQSYRNAVAGVVVAQPDVTNMAAATWLFRVRTEDSAGAYGPDALAPMRDLYLFGSAGTRPITASTTQLPTDAWFVCQATTNITVQLLPADQWLNGVVGAENASPNGSTVTIQFAAGESDNYGASSKVIPAGDRWSGRAHG